MSLLPYLDGPDNYEPYDEIDGMSYLDIRDLKHRYEGAKDWFEGVIQELYHEEEVDVDRLHECIEEMASYFKMPMPRNWEKLYDRFKTN